MTPRPARKLDTPEVFKVVMDLGQFSIMVDEQRPGYVVMRRYANGKQYRKALGHMAIRDSRGAILPGAIKQARDQAAAWYSQVTGQAPVLAIAPPRATVTVGETWDLITDPSTGKYPHRSQFRDELHRALEFAAVTWGSDTPWTAIDSDRWTALIRKRLTDQVTQGRVGLRSTEITVSRIITASNWLRKKRRIPIDAALLETEWRDEIAAFWKGLTGQASIPEPFRPRHSDEEARRLIEASWTVDPRFGLLMALGAELRLGQVARAKRSDLDLEANTFTVHGAGDKKGETINLTVGQRAAVDRALAGYLAVLEESVWFKDGSDYRLFPAGKLLGKKHGTPIVAARTGQPIASNTIRKWYRLTETLAEVERIPYRGAYGVRRAAVDHGIGQKISSSGLKSLGGWSSDDVPRRIYADQENKHGREEAAEVRASFRGESND